MAKIYCQYLKKNNFKYPKQETLISPHQVIDVEEVLNCSIAVEEILNCKSQTTATRGIEYTEPVSILARQMKISNMKMAVRKARDAYTDFLPIKQPKMQDVNTLLKHIYLPYSIMSYSTLRSHSASAEANEYEETLYASKTQLISSNHS